MGKLPATPAQKVERLSAPPRKIRRLAGALGSSFGRARQQVGCSCGALVLVLSATIRRLLSPWGPRGTPADS
ncbi:Dna polymerase Delta Catalytic Subunit [Manis pentadactyla]|nr:Dna polymerase Delta Catalytic Subunit [Manis pentadactyla]